MFEIIGKITVFLATVGIFYMGYKLLYKYFIKKGYRVIWVISYKKNKHLTFLISTFFGFEIGIIKEQKDIDIVLNENYTNKKIITNINKLKKKYKIA